MFAFCRCRQPLEISGPVLIPEKSHQVATELQLNLPLDETDGDVTSAPIQTLPAMTSGTLPFGGAMEGGGTSRSVVSDASAIAEELRGVVRAEMKKLVEVRRNSDASCHNYATSCNVECAVGT